MATTASTASKIRLKSRHGCVQCKRRKVKCDEGRPTCRNCKRFGDVCDYTTKAGAASASSVEEQRPLPPATTTTTNMNRDSVPACSVPETGSNSGTLSTAKGMPTPTISVTSSTTTTTTTTATQSDDARTDLELMHHFTAFTSTTLFDTDGKRGVFQRYAPRLALDKTYLLHAIFAIAAMHIADTSPPGRADEHRRYCNMAAAHHGRALAALPPDLERAVERDYEPVFAFSGLLAIYSFTLAWQAVRDEGAHVCASFAHWLQMPKGAESVVWSTGVADRVMSGRFEAIFLDHDAPAAADVPLSAQVTAQLDGLCRFAEWTESRRRGGAAGVSDDEMLLAYYDAVARLKEAYRKYGVPPGLHCRISAALAWPVQIRPVFITAVAEARAPAVLIAMHFCVLFHRIRRYWWIDEGPAVLVRAFAATLPDDVKGWAAWCEESIAR